MTRLHQCRSSPGKLLRNHKRPSRSRICLRRFGRSTGSLERRQNHISRRKSSFHRYWSRSPVLTRVYRKPKWDFGLDGAGARNRAPEGGSGGLGPVLHSVMLAVLRVEYLGPDSGFRPAGFPELERVPGGPAVRLGMHQLPDLLYTLLLAPL